MVNLCLNYDEKLILKSLVGKKLIKVRHDPYDKFEDETVYGRVELFFDEFIVLVDYDYEVYPLFGGDDDHPKFAIRIIEEKDAVSSFRDTEQIDVPFGKTLSGVTLAEEYVDVEWDGKKDSARILKAIILKFGDYEVALQGDFMIPLIDIIKGTDVASKLIRVADEFSDDPETKFKAERFFLDI